MEKLFAEVQAKKIVFGRKSAKLIGFHVIADKRNRETVVKESDEW